MEGATNLQPSCASTSADSVAISAPIASPAAISTGGYGPPEAWFLQANASIAEIEELNKAVDAAPGLADETDRFAQADAANISSFTGILTRYLPDLSNGPNIDVSQMRVWEVLVFQVRPGHEANFEEAAKLYESTLDQAKIEAPWTTYGVMAGMPGPPISSLFRTAPWPRSTRPPALGPR